MSFEFNTDKLYNKLAKYTPGPHKYEFNELPGKKLRYIPSDKIGTIFLNNTDLVLRWDDGWRIEVVLTTEHGLEFIKKSEIFDPDQMEKQPIPSIKLTVVADSKSVDIMSNDFTFSLLRDMYIIDGVPTDGIGCQVNDELERQKIEKLGRTISDAFKNYFN